MSGTELKAWRERFGLTQQQLADKFGVTRTTVQNWESSESEIPRAVEMGCQLWGERLRQENPNLGPVTLVYSDGPMFIDPYGPRRRPAMMQQEAYQTNAVALARVQQLWGRDEFHNPFIIEESRASLWNIVELERVVTGNDTAAPTLANMLRAVAKHVRDDKFIARNGAKLTTPAEAQAHKGAIEAEAEKLDQIAAAEFQVIVKSGGQIDAIFARLRALGARPPDVLVSNIAHALVIIERHPLEPEARRVAGGLQQDYKGFAISWPTIRLDSSKWTVNLASENPGLLAKLGGNIVIHDFISLENAIEKARRYVDELA